MKFLWCAIAAAIHAAGCVVALESEQVHLAFSGIETAMTIDFVADSEQAFVQYSKATALLSTTATTDSFFREEIGWLHRTEMIGLEPMEEYRYRVGDKETDTWSAWTMFRAGSPRRGGEYGRQIQRKGEDASVSESVASDGIAAVYADFGLYNDVSMNRLIKEGEVGVFDYALHVGDIAYNLFDDNSERGNKFMNLVEKFAKSKPLMVAAGNHERADNFTQYFERFHGIASHAGQRSTHTENNFYYSFNVGLIHYVVIDTEVYKYIDQTAASPYPFTPEEQLTWLEADLIAANKNREEVPWIVMMGHKGWYMNQLGDWRVQGDLTTNFTGFDLLGCKYGVDLYLTGHVHIYQRFLPVRGPTKLFFMAPPTDVDCDSVSEDGHTYTNPKYMPTLVVASPGDQEITPRVVCPGLDVASKIFWKDSQIVCSCSYGFGHLQAVNSTHIYWEFVQTGKASNINDTLNEATFAAADADAARLDAAVAEARGAMSVPLVEHLEAALTRATSATDKGEELLDEMLREAVRAQEKALRAQQEEAEADAADRETAEGKSDEDGERSVTGQRLVRDYLWIVQEDHGTRDYCDV